MQAHTHITDYVITISLLTLRNHVGILHDTLSLICSFNSSNGTLIVTQLYPQQPKHIKIKTPWNIPKWEISSATSFSKLDAPEI